MLKLQFVCLEHLEGFCGFFLEIDWFRCLNFYLGLDGKIPGYFDDTTNQKEWVILTMKKSCGNHEEISEAFFRDG